jgi:hypothetical protein
MQRKVRARRRKGVKPRAQYEAASLSRQRPWEAQGISRRTWERRRKAAAQSRDASLATGTLLGNGCPHTCVKHTTASPHDTKEAISTPKDAIQPFTSLPLELRLLALCLPTPTIVSVYALAA